MPPRDRRKRRLPAKATIAPTIPTVIIEGLPVGGNGVPVGLITMPPFVCVGKDVGMAVAVFSGAVVTIGFVVGVGANVGVTFNGGVGDGVGVGTEVTLGVDVTEGAGGLVCWPAA
jgi:hypothetical protein